MTTRTVTESQVLRAVIDTLLWQYKAVIIRVNSGAMQPDENGKGRYVPFNRWQCLGEAESTAGISDVLALLPPPPGAVVLYPDAVGKWPAGVSLWGMPLYCECKSPGRRRNGIPAQPSPDQARFLAAVRERGGLALVIDDVDMLVSELERLGY